MDTQEPRGFRLKHPPQRKPYLKVKLPKKQNAGEVLTPKLSSQSTDFPGVWTDQLLLPQRVKGGALLSPPALLDWTRVIAPDRAQSQLSALGVFGTCCQWRHDLSKGNANAILFPSAAHFRQSGSRKEPSAPTIALGAAPAQPGPSKSNKGLATHRPSFRISDVAIGNCFVDSVSKVRPSDVPHHLVVAPNSLQAKEGDFPATQRKPLLQERPSRGCTTSQSLQMQEQLSLGSQAVFSTDCLSRTGPSGR